jgi:hypothetical protein
MVNKPSDRIQRRPCPSSSLRIASPISIAQSFELIHFPSANVLPLGLERDIQALLKEPGNSVTLNCRDHSFSSSLPPGLFSSSPRPTCCCCALVLSSSHWVASDTKLFSSSTRDRRFSSIAANAAGQCVRHASSCCRCSPIVAVVLPIVQFSLVLEVLIGASGWRQHSNDSAH